MSRGHAVAIRWHPRLNVSVAVAWLLLLLLQYSLPWRFAAGEAVPARARKTEANRRVANPLNPGDAQAGLAATGPKAGPRPTRYYPAERSALAEVGAWQAGGALPASNHVINWDRLCPILCGCNSCHQPGGARRGPAEQWGSLLRATATLLKRDRKKQQWSRLAGGSRR